MNEPGGMPAQKLHAYVVSLVFTSGRNIVQTAFAPGPEGAVAIVTHAAMIHERDETPISSVLVMPIAEDWLRVAHRVVVEGGKPEGEVVKLVSDNPRPLGAPEGDAKLSGNQHVWSVPGEGAVPHCIACGAVKDSTWFPVECPSPPSAA